MFDCGAVWDSALGEPGGVPDLFHMHMHKHVSSPQIKLVLALNPIDVNLYMSTVRTSLIVRASLASCSNDWRG